MNTDQTCPECGDELGAISNGDCCIAETIRQILDERMQELEAQGREPAVPEEWLVEQVTRRVHPAILIAKAKEDDCDNDGQQIASDCEGHDPHTSTSTDEWPDEKDVAYAQSPKTVHDGEWKKVEPSELPPSFIEEAKAVALQKALRSKELPCLSCGSTNCEGEIFPDNSGFQCWCLDCGEAFYAEGSITLENIRMRKDGQ